MSVSRPWICGIPDRDNRREINCLMEDRRGALWIGTMQNLYRRSADGRVEPIAPSSRADLLTVHALLEDRDGRIWVGSRYAGVFQLTVDASVTAPDGGAVYAAPRDLPTNWINTIVQSADGAVWVGSNRGVFHFAAESWRGRLRDPCLFDVGGTDEVWAVAEDRQHNLWLGRKPVSVGKLWHRGLTRFSAADGLSGANSINATRNGDVIAVGGFDARALASVPVRRNEVRRRQGFRWQARQAGWGWSQMVLQDRTGDWWIGTDQGLLPFHESRNDRRCELVRHRPRSTRPETVLPPSRCSACSRTRGATCGSGRSAGPATGYRVGSGAPAPSTTTPTRMSPVARPAYVASFAEDRAGHVWIGFGGARWPGASPGRALRAFHRG